MCIYKKIKICVLFSAGQKKKPYTEEEKSLIREKFKQRILERQSITGEEIRKFIKENRCLEGRNVEQIRSFLQYDIRKEAPKKRMRKDSPNVRNTIPTSVYNVFNEFIDKKKLPSIQEVCDRINLSPTFEKYSPRQLLGLVKKAIEYDE